MVHRPQRLAEIFFAWRNTSCSLNACILHPRLGTRPNMVLIECMKDAQPGLLFTASICL